MPGYPKDYLDAAVNAVRDEIMTVRAASRKYGVPVTTISNHVTGVYKDNTRPGRKCSLPKYIEESIRDYVFRSAEAGFPMTREMILRRVGKLVNELNLKMGFLVSSIGGALRKGILKWS